MSNENKIIDKEMSVDKFVKGVQGRTNEEELEAYIKEEMEKLRLNSMTTGLKIACQMVLDICDNQKFGMREKLREIKKFCKIGLYGRGNKQDDEKGIT